MNAESNKIIQLEKELAYYKKQVDKLSGITLSSQYAFTQQSNVSRKYINGFQIIADIQRSFSFYSSKKDLYEQFLDSIISQMSLDKAVLLVINPGNKELKPVLWKGFDDEESLKLNQTVICPPDEFFEEKKSILGSVEKKPSEFEVNLQNRLLAPNFIFIPLVKNQQIWGALFVGMNQGFNTISYIPLSASNVNMFESLAGMISSMTQQLEQREVMETERNRIARDMHDDIGSELSRISITCKNLIKQFANEETIIKDLAIINESTGAIVNNIGNIIWALNPVNNTLDNLLAYLREYAFEYLEIHGLVVVFVLPETPEIKIISHDAKSQFFMVVKESLHNIIKHANATHVNINIGLFSNKLCCSIADNGIGFSTNGNNRFGNGLRNMKQRIAEIGGKLVIDSEPGKGTRLEIELLL